jgi:hypothetical protein
VDFTLGPGITGELELYSFGFDASKAMVQETTAQVIRVFAPIVTAH